MPMYLQAVIGLTHRIEYYKRDNSIGIRRRADNKAAGAFRSKTFSETKLRRIGDDCLRKLNAGVAEEVVKLWAVVQCQRQ
jgi:hypothetical protein